jgi:hypothetical protein
VNVHGPRSLAGPTDSPPTDDHRRVHGWNDAGDAASNSVRHLIEVERQPLAEIDPEEFTDFATVRPHVRPVRHEPIDRVAHGGAVERADARRRRDPVARPEPALRWRMFSEQIMAPPTSTRRRCC